MNYLKCIMYKGKCVICRNWKTFESEWSVKNYTEKTHIEIGSYGHSKYEFYLQYSVNGRALNVSRPGQVHIHPAKGRHQRSKLCGGRKSRLVSTIILMWVELLCCLYCHHNSSLAQTSEFWLPHVCTT